MIEEEYICMVNKIFTEVFNKKCKMNLEQLLKEFAFDVRLPNKVIDTIDGKETWISSKNSDKYISQVNMLKYDEANGWMKPKKDIKSLNDILNLWNTINYMTTERNYDSINIVKSDTIYNCENVYRSLDCRKCKNVLFSDSCADSEYIMACQRSSNLEYCIKADDSDNCSNSYSVVCSSKISNSIFIQDSNSLYECMFCSHISNRKYCIANMQFDIEEYKNIKYNVIKWIFSQFV